jgi:predicted nuclease of predicted toxin-antitoxin system
MNFLFDENFPKAARPILEALGHQVFDLWQEGVRGSSDEMILRMAAENAVFATI